MGPKKVLIAVVAALCGCTLLAVAKVPVYSEGGVLIDAKGMSLYTFDRDPRGKSACSGQCAASSPPLIAAADAKPAGDYSLVRRDDGAKQWAYKGKPLYLGATDQKPGDRTGDGFNNVWRVAKP